MRALLVLLVALGACDSGKSSTATTAAAAHESACGSAGSASSGSATVVQATPEPAVDLVVHMERTVCYGACPAYKLDIAADGSVTFLGEEYVASKHGKRRISGARMRALSELIDAARFYDLRDEYVGEGCTSVWTDSPTTKIRVVRAGKVKAIERYLGCEGAPAGLDELASAIDLAAGTDEWIGQPKHR